MQVSTVSQAVMAALSTPVWPTMSPLAKLSTTRSKGRPAASSSARVRNRVSVTSMALICGFSS